MRRTPERFVPLYKPCYVTEKRNATFHLFIAGPIALAVPVFDAGGVPRAALALHAPTARMSLDEVIRRLPRLQAAAKAMRQLL